ncbi:MAG TPA: DUF4214 domain-containing protein [Iamia sp.]|nr:DUF4214 domain-containing protein [Iamia sp.]
MTRARRRALVAALALAAVATVVPAAPASSYPDAPGTAAPDGACEGELRRLHDEARAVAGRPALREDPAFDHITRAWALRLAQTRRLAHNPDHVARIARVVPDRRRISENVAMAASPAALHRSWMASAAHRANILDTAVQRVAFGCARDRDGRVWATVNLVGAASSIADRRPAPFRSAGDASARLRWWLLAAGPGTAQLDADAARLLTTWSAADLAVHLASSSTHAALVPGVVRLYGAAFDRHPDAAGLVHWVRERQKGMSLTRMAGIFVASAELRALYGTLGDRAFVEQIYRNVLDREPDRAGTDFWVAELRRGVSRATVLLGFSESKENREATAAAATVSWAFAQLIARNPTAEERRLWTGRLATGTTAEELVRFLVASAAFTRRVGTGGY